MIPILTFFGTDEIKIIRYIWGQIITQTDLIRKLFPYYFVHNPMLKKGLLLFICTIVTCIPSEKLMSQSISVGSLQDEQITLQLLLNSEATHSLINRPVSYSVYREMFAHPDSISMKRWWNSPIKYRELISIGGLSFAAYPLTIQNTINSRFPHSENNMAAWYGRGNTIELKTGAYITSKFVTLNFNPHIIYHENKDFLRPRFIPRDREGRIRYIPEGIDAIMDAPFRFGPDPFSLFDFGNSSLRLHYSKYEIGISTEPLIWGPAIQYPLIMSNNAPGIPHFFVNIIEPINIPYFGNIQFRWIFGYPHQSDYYDGDGADETRFTNAVNFAYSPNFYKNLTLGITRVYHLYEVDGLSLNNITRIFDPFSRAAIVRTQGGDAVRQARNQTASFYFQLKLPQANAKIYAEIYREDHSYNLRDLLVQPLHNSAYNFGLQKISYLPWIDFLKTSIEITNLTESQLSQVRHQTFFYSHSRIRQGHTNNGQLLGAAIGPGSNSQFVAFDAYKDDYKVGVFAQRVVDNDNFHFDRGSASLAPSRNFGDYFRHRVDLNLGLNFLYGPGPFYINSRVIWTKAYNYGRFDYGRFDGVTIQNYERRDRTNIQFQIGITYVL